MNWKQLVEREDYYINEEGLVVFTEKYHLRRGNCCGNGCKHCPFDHQNVAPERRVQLRNEKAKENDSLDA